LIALTFFFGNAVILVPNVAASPLTGPTFRLYPIEATFHPSTFLTTYFAYMAERRSGGGELTREWTIKLELIDRAGSPDSTASGSGAAVDLGCTNNGVGVLTSQTSFGSFSKVQLNLTDFVWHHPDAANSIPAGRYHCNHLDEGPHGHQGLVTVTVYDNLWRCSENFRGTNSSSPQATYAVKPNPNVENLTASLPKCQKRR
jgi:hypothetical protein